MNHYQVLGVQPTASQHAIKRAYRERALRYHPDRNPDDLERSTEMFQRVQQAYEVLSNSKLRKEYDLRHVSYGKSRERPSPKSSAANERAEKIIRDFLNVQDQTSYESKDALVAILFIYAGHLSIARWLSIELQDSFKLVSLFIVGTGAAVFARALARLFWTRLQGYAPDNFVRIALYNICAVLTLNFIAQTWSYGRLDPYILTPLTPGLLMGIPIALFAAAVGRAVSAGLGSLLGFVVGGFTGAIVTAIIGLWLVLGFLVDAETGQVDSKQAFMSLFYGVTLASALGSVSIGSLFIYDFIDLVESIFDRFRPGNKSSGLQVTD